MRPTTFQHAELRDENDEIIQQGTYGKGSALSNSTNDGWIDYVMNNLEALNNNATPLDSPAFTGTPTAPTPPSDEDSTQIATTEFVQNIKDDEVTRADEKYLPLAGGTLTGAVNGVTPTAGDESTKLATTEYVREEVRQHSGIPIGHIYFSVNPNIPQGSLPLFGGEFSRETYSDLWAWVQEQTGYLKTESEWQALSTANNGNVPYYSSGDGSTTFRVPSLQCWVRGANGSVSTVGSYLAAGLPNITGTIRPLSWGTNSALSGAFSEDSKYIDRGVSTGTQIGTQTINFNASSSNSIYGNSSTVQPESIVGLWLVKAYGTIEDTGTIDEQQYIDDRIAALPNTFLPLAGGTMIGNIIFGNNAFIQNQSADILGYNQFEIGCGEPETQSGTEWGAGGAKITFHSYHADNPTRDDGAFHILASDGTNNRDFNGKPDGTLKWDGKDVERVNAKGTNYIRYESGLQLVFDKIEVSGASSYVKTYTYPVAFKSGSSVNIATGGRWTANNEQASIQNDTNTKFEVNITNAGSNSHNWFFIAIGYWK